MRRRTVLHIEDSGVEREIICRLLSSEGMEVIAAGDAGEGIELARRFRPDLILIDLHLPDMDGRTLAETLRSISHLENVPIVALSASIDGNEIGEARSYCEGFMEKPVDMDLFPRRIMELIEAGRGGESEAADQGAGETGGEVAASQEVEELLETLEKIRAVMSHDLRTPLTVIISYATTVAREKAGPLNDQQKEMLETLVEHGFKMNELISDLVRQAQQTLTKYKGSGLES